MADTKISALTAVTTPAGADEFAVNQSAASKKLTLRQVQEFVTDKGSDVASAATVTLGDGHYFHITGTTTITDIDFTDSWDGRFAVLVFDGALTLTHNGTSLILPGGQNIITSAGDMIGVVVESGDNVRVVFYQPAVGVRIVKNLGSDFTSPGTTIGKATNLDTLIGVGTWVFQYDCMYQSSDATVGVKFGVNHTGTVSRFVVECTGFEATTTASTGAADQTHTAFGLRAGGQNRAVSTTTSIYGGISVDTINADMYAVIRGLIVVTASGNLELYFGSEVATGTQTLELPTSLTAWKIA